MSKYRITLNGRVYEMEVEILRDDGELTAEKPDAAAAGKEAGTASGPVNGRRDESPSPGQKAEDARSGKETEASEKKTASASLKETAGKAGSSGNNGNAGNISGAGAVLSPMPGTVLKVRHQAGEAVRKGQTILVLEAMKMENDIQADRDGILQEMLVSEGQTVSGNEPLFVIGD